MRLVTYREGTDGLPRIGVVREVAVIDIRDLPAREGRAWPGTMLDLIARGDIAALRRAVSDFDGQGTPLKEVQLLAPIPRPHSNVIAVGRNYAAHAEESARAHDDTIQSATFFTKAVNTIIGPFDDIPVDNHLTTKVDWEVELAVVIGSTAKRIRQADALNCVFGYMVVNDVSARDLQYGHGGQFFFGKSLDGFCPTGPCIVTADEIQSPQNLKLRLRVNGVEKQAANTTDMTYGVARLIEILSSGMTLDAGQIIATGTPEGVGDARTPPEYLHPGDIVEAEIEGIGTIRNRVISM